MSGWTNYNDTWRPPSVSEIIVKIKNLKTCSAPGDNGITTTMIKKAMGTLAPILAVLARCVIDLGYFPKIFKHSKIK